MDSCNYVNQYLTEDQGTSYHNCGSRVNVREIEFKNPEYRDLNKTIFLCESHYLEVFSDIMNEERLARRDADNLKFRYNRDFANAQKQSEYWNAADFKQMHYSKVQKAFDHWKKIRKGICRYEACNYDLKLVRKVWMIRVYTSSGREWMNMFFCSKNHFEKIKMRVGMIRPEKQGTKPISLDTFIEE